MYRVIIGSNRVRTHIRQEWREVFCETSRHYAIQGQIENDKRSLLSDVHSTIRPSVCKTLCCASDFLFIPLCCYLKFDRIQRIKEVRYR